MRTFGEAPPPPGFLERLKTSLSKTGLGEILTKKKLDADAIAELEEALIRADMGTVQAKAITAAVAKNRYDAEISGSELRAVLAREIAALLTPIQKPLVMDDSKKPFVILVAGVNGTGKTTTIGKMAKRLAEEGAKVTVAAGDTFRAAAVEQLATWAERAGAAIVRPQQQGQDPASVAFQTVERAERDGIDIAIVDTAGRLQTKSGLMDELGKIRRVIEKQTEIAEVLLVLDATTGQNGLSQAEAFIEHAGVTGLVITKLDGSAKGGFVLAVQEKTGIPIKLVGQGEGIGDLTGFTPHVFVQGLVD